MLANIGVVYVYRRFEWQIPLRIGNQIRKRIGIQQIAHLSN
jgi:hypothetical protein